MGQFYPQNVYELRKILLVKYDAFKIPYKEQQKLFQNIVVSDFDSICVEEDSHKETETTLWIGMNVQISVSIPSNLIHEPIFLCDASPNHFVSSFLTALERIATKIKTQNKLKFCEVETAMEIKLCE